MVVGVEHVGYRCVKWFGFGCVVAMRYFRGCSYLYCGVREEVFFYV